MYEYFITMTKNVTRYRLTNILVTVLFVYHVKLNTYMILDLYLKSNNKLIDSLDFKK